MYNIYVYIYYCIFISIIKTFSIKMIEYVGMSKPKKYVNKVGMGNSRNKIKQTNSI